MMNFIISLIFYVTFWGGYGIGGISLFIVPVFNDSSEEFALIILLFYLGIGYYLHKFMFEILTNIEEGLYRRKQKSNDYKQITKIIKDYGLCMENFPDVGVVFYDELFLPYKKVEIQDALIKGYKLTKNESLKIGMENLGWFQKDIGQVPLRGFQDYSNLSTDDILQNSKEIDNGSNINKKKYEEMNLKADREYADILKLL